MPVFHFFEKKIIGFENMPTLLPYTFFKVHQSLKVFYVISQCKKAHYEAI